MTERGSATSHSHRHTRFLAVTGSWSMWVGDDGVGCASPATTSGSSSHPLPSTPSKCCYSRLTWLMMQEEEDWEEEEPSSIPPLCTISLRSTPSSSHTHQHTHHRSRMLSMAHRCEQLGCLNAGGARGQLPRLLLAPCPPSLLLAPPLLAGAPPSSSPTLLPYLDCSAT